MRKTKCSSFVSAIKEFAMGATPPPLVWSGQWSVSWGKNNRYRFWGHREKRFCIVYDWSTGEKELFYKIPTHLRGNYSIPEPKKDIGLDYGKLRKAKKHPYARKKGIDLHQLDLRVLGENLIVPLRSIVTNDIVSWQTISPTGDKKFKAGCPLTGGVYFKIGNKTPEVFVCEGLATGWSVHEITKCQVWCAFSRSNLETLAKELLKYCPPNKVIIAGDNDGTNTLKPDIKDKRFFYIIPANRIEGEDGKPLKDFNDFRNDVIEKFRLVKMIRDIQLQKDDLTNKEIREKMSEYVNAYLHYRDRDDSQPPRFLDKHKIIPESNAILLCGATGAGKSGFSLNFIKDMLALKKKCVIWEHSETNLKNRLNAWLKKENIDNKPIITSSKNEVITHFRKGNIVLIDDTDSFFSIKRPTDRREVADILEDISWLCQLADFTMILAHYQTKTSRGESNIQLRSGGNMAWINKVRYAVIIETSMQQEEVISKSGVRRLEDVERSILTVQKGHYNPGKRDKMRHYWLDDKYRIHKEVKSSTFNKIMAKKLNPQVDTIVSKINRIIFSYMVKQNTREMPRETCYKEISILIGPNTSARWYYLSLSNYKLNEKRTHVILKGDKENKKERDDVGPAPF